MWIAEKTLQKLQPLNNKSPNDRMIRKIENKTELIQNYKSRDGMQSAIFGPAFWMTIHITSFNYPVEPTEEDKKNYSNWLMSIGKILPCRYCRENFPKNIEAAGYNYDTCMKSRDSFSKFCYELHDVVNKMLKKTSPPFEEIRSKYELFRAKCLSKEETNKLNREKKELGCIRPIHSGAKGKCVISIVPQDYSSNHFIVHEKCKPEPT